LLNKFITYFFIISSISLNIALTVFSTTVHAAGKNVHIYKDENGNTLITNKSRNPSNYRKVKTIYFKPWRDQTLEQKRAYVHKPRKSSFDALISKIATEYGLEPAFVKAIVHVESAFKPEAKSHAGALGLMQLMPATAGMYNLKEDYFNPEKNVTTGVKHMKMLMKRYGNDKELSLAAYNAGEGSVARAGGIPTNGETELYVPKVLELYNKYAKKSSE